MGPNLFVINAPGKGSNVSIVFRISAQIPGLEHRRVFINRPLQGRRKRNTTLSLRTGLQMTKGLVHGLEHALGIEVLGVAPSPKVTSHLRMKERARRRSTGMTVNGQGTPVFETRMGSPRVERIVGPRWLRRLELPPVCHFHFLRSCPCPCR